MFSDFNFIIYFIIDYIVLCLLTPFVYSVENCDARREATEEFYRKTYTTWWVRMYSTESISPISQVIFVNY